MISTALLFMGKLDQEGIHYSTDERGDTSVVIIEIPGNTFKSQSFVFFFDDNNKTVDVKAFSICAVPEDKLLAMYKTINNVNSEYRWVKLYLDSDNEITLSGDAIVDSDSVGEECFEILLRYAKILDDVYPNFMRTLYA